MPEEQEKNGAAGFNPIAWCCRSFKKREETSSI